MSMRISAFCFVLFAAAIFAFTPVWADENSLETYEKEIRAIYEDYKQLYTAEKPDEERLRSWFKQHLADGFLGTFEVFSDFKPYGELETFNKNEMTLSSLKAVENYRDHTLLYDDFKVTPIPNRAGAYEVQHSYRQKGEYYLEQYSAVLDDPWTDFTASSRCTDEVIYNQERYSVLTSECQTSIDFHKTTDNSIGSDPMPEASHDL